MKLEVFVITYNRSISLNNTLNALAGTPIANYPITVLDNCSTDNTAHVASRFYQSFSNYRLISNKINVGACANILKAIELCESEYIWILCDDDLFNLTDLIDIEEAIQSGTFDLIHVGAHPEKDWKFGGQYKTPRELIIEGYPYFKFSSFLPCNIFKRESFTKRFMIEAYNNIANAYPQMPYLISLYSEDKTIYIAKNQIVTAVVSGQSYNVDSWFIWWMKTCEGLRNIEDTRIAFLDQWNEIGISNIEGALYGLKWLLQQNKEKYYVEYFIDKYLLLSEKDFIYDKEPKSFLKSFKKRIGKS
jgi:glycosyltransferase involved in cell wall biosynthesis